MVPAILVPSPTAKDAPSEEDAEGVASEGSDEDFDIEGHDGKHEQPHSEGVDDGVDADGGPGTTAEMEERGAWG